MPSKELVTKTLYQTYQERGQESPGHAAHATDDDKSENVVMLERRCVKEHKPCLISQLADEKIAPVLPLFVSCHSIDTLA